MTNSHETARPTDAVPTRVVIAEDEAIIRLDLKETLEEEGYEVVGETGRGDEALTLLEPDRGVRAGQAASHVGANHLRGTEQLGESVDEVIRVDALIQRLSVFVGHDRIPAPILATARRPLRKIQR